MTGFILWLLGFALVWRVTGRDVLNTDGTIKNALTGWVRVAASALWPIFAFLVIFDAVKDWIAARRNKS